LSAPGEMPNRRGVKFRPFTPAPPVFPRPEPTSTTRHERNGADMGAGWIAIAFGAVAVVAVATTVVERTVERRGRNRNEGAQ
jgi:hypothetical protein